MRDAKFSPVGNETLARQFEAEIDCTRERAQQFADYVKMLIVRPGLTVKFNGDVVGLMDQTGLDPRKPIRDFVATLKTEIGDTLKPTMRQTKVEVYEAYEGEMPMLYELGIPVVETGDRWHVNIHQKCPLNADRDNVTPAYLRSVRVAVMNEMYEDISADDTTAAWANEATSDPNCSPAAVKTFWK